AMLRASYKRDSGCQRYVGWCVITKNLFSIARYKSAGGAMAKSADSAAQRRKLLGEIARLAEIAIFGTLSETYRTCGQAGCHCQGDGPKHGPHLNVSYRGEKGKTTGYCVPKGAHEASR